MRAADAFRTWNISVRTNFTIIKQLEMSLYFSVLSLHSAFHPLGVDKWVVSCNQTVAITSHGGAVWWTFTRWRQVWRACRVKAEWSIPERFSSDVCHSQMFNVYLFISKAIVWPAWVCTPVECPAWASSCCCVSVDCRTLTLRSFLSWARSTVWKSVNWRRRTLNWWTALPLSTTCMLRSESAAVSDVSNTKF